MRIIFKNVDIHTPMDDFFFVFVFVLLKPTPMHDKIKLYKLVSLPYSSYSLTNRNGSLFKY